MSYDTPLLPFLESIGAHRSAADRRATAAHFGDPSWEHQVVRRSVGLVDFSYLGAVRILGKDRVRFLENMLTQKVGDLTPGRGRLAALLTPKGKLRTLFRLLAFDDSFIALLEGARAADLVSALDPFIILEEVKLEEESDRWGGIHVAGPESARLLASLANSPIPHLRAHDYRSLALPGIDAPAWAVRNCVTGEDGFDLVLPRERLVEGWKTLLAHEEPKPAPVGLEAFDVLRVEAGTPLPGIDFDEDLGPLEAGLEEAVSFEKGCFPGQEVVAKTHYRGKPPKQIVGLRLSGDDPPPAGSPLLVGGDEVGRVTSVVRSPTFGLIALGVVRTSVLEKRVPLRVVAGDREMAALPTETPFR